MRAIALAVMIIVVYVVPASAGCGFLGLFHCRHIAHHHHHHRQKTKIIIKKVVVVKHLKSNPSRHIHTGREIDITPIQPVK